MIAMNLVESACDGLAGFAIARSTDGKTFAYTKNRLGFNPNAGAYATKDPNQQLADEMPSNIAPFQKFRWADYPPENNGAPFTYRVEALYFDGGNAPLTTAPPASPGAPLASTGASPASTGTPSAPNGAPPMRVGYSVTFQLALSGDAYPNFSIGFTRGYISSQAFADRYQGLKTLRPADAANPVHFDTNTNIPIAPEPNKPPVTWRELYKWLGGHAREILANFTQTIKTDGSAFDVFAYDLDEPDFIEFVAEAAKAGKAAGKSVRMLLDDATLHTKKGAREILSAELLEAAGVQLKRGHFKRYAHDKCVIERDAQGKATRLLTGSANFSVRGLYVQSNSIIVVNDPQVAELYGKAFDEAWSDMSEFASSEIASEWFDASGAGIPAFSVSFAPHHSASVSLDRVAAAIRNAKSSVLFAVMELGGGGDVLAQLTALQQRPELFSYGVTQTTTGVKFYKSGGTNGILVPFSYLKAHVPAPFSSEWNGGMGQVIHHKFVVVDFNGSMPLVYCGSSNLAEGGEQSNGDNLLEIRDPAIVTFYAVQAIQLVDH